MKFNTKGELQNEFGGKVSEDALHGFIVPSPYFDIDITEYGDLWVVNPGLHTLENYTSEGNLREHWKASGAKTEGFSGCCNPAHYCFLPDGSFVTSEKGLVRIKVYKPSGEFSGVVAGPNKFDDKIEGQAPDVAVDSQGNIYALDLDRNVLRVFEKK
jgi:sugar lactone lactonase YvrE